MPVGDEIRLEVQRYWDADAALFDDSPSHHVATDLERAAWTSIFKRMLPTTPCSILDVGTGTGYLALPLARLGHQVTAVDFAPQMLERLEHKARAEGLRIDTICCDASAVPRQEFDVVTERNLIWTLPDPIAALTAWREAAPRGRLVIFGGLWGPGAGRLELLRRRGRSLRSRLSKDVVHNHLPNPADAAEQLPFGKGISPTDLIRLIQLGQWRKPEIERLRDLEWAQSENLPSLLDQLLGVIPRFVVSAE